MDFLMNADAGIAAGGMMIIWVFAIVINIAIAMWGASVTERNGRGKALGFVLGWFLGIVGVIVAYLID